ncbi:FecR family protein [Sunxiuqinia sp. A32]|uniref:FecR family protein n=1 Tax=Sunxiuqinia sp. A32 TaxID=3461496 RepID=UPI0040467C75
MAIDKKIVKKYLLGNFTLAEKEVVDNYFTKDEYSSQVNNLLLELISDSEYNSVAKIPDSVRYKLSHQILLSKQTKKLKIEQFISVFFRYAAVLMIPILLVSIYFYIQSTSNYSNETWISVHSPYGTRTQFSLPDGSTVWLNGGSVIKYPVSFSRHRDVVLTGEAFFDVVKNPQLPFSVDANDITVKVLGTSFNVVSYDADSIAEVVVETGKVKVYTNTTKKQKVVLLPSERLVINQIDSRLTKYHVNVENYTSWKSGRLIFYNDNLDEVIRKLSRYFNVDFIVEKDVNREQLFRAIMADENLEEVLRYMSLTMNLNYSVIDRKTDGDGNLSKIQVIIKK